MHHLVGYLSMVIHIFKVRLRHQLMGKVHIFLIMIDDYSMIV